MGRGRRDHYGDEWRGRRRGQYPSGDDYGPHRRGYPYDEVPHRVTLSTDPSSAPRHVSPDVAARATSEPETPTAKEFVPSGEPSPLSASPAATRFLAPILVTPGKSAERLFRALEELGLPAPVNDLADLSAANPENLRAAYVAYQRIVLFGGPDIPRQWYGTPSPTTPEPAETDRDRLERQLVTWALAEEKPIRAICRGMQLLNVVAGGSLWPEIKELSGAFRQHLNGEHMVYIDPRSLLAARLEGVRGVRHIRNTRTQKEWLVVDVISAHHQCVREVAPGFRAVAWSEDGLVEGIEHVAKPDLWWGVQFHPERALDCAANRVLAKSLVGLPVTTSDRMFQTDWWERNTRRSFLGLRW